MKQVGILGAGITGLTCAYHILKKEELQVTIFDSQDKVGGLLGSVNTGGVLLEKYYHHIFPGFTDMIGLIDELGLKNDLKWHKTKMGFFYNNKIYPFNGPVDLLKFSPLGLADRFNLGLSLLKFSKITDVKAMDRISAVEYLRGNLSKKACDIVWEPLLKSKFGDSYESVSAAWLWDRIRSRAESVNLAKSKECLGYLSGSFYKVAEGLKAKIAESNGKILLNSSIKKISPGIDKIKVITDKGEFEFDYLISTIPLAYLKDLVANIDKDAAAAIGEIRYQSSISVILRLKKQLSNFYWISVSAKDIPFVAVVEHTNMTGAGDYNGEHLVYLSRYISDADPLYLKSDAGILEEFLTGLSKIFVDFDRKGLIEGIVIKEKYTQPVFVKDFYNLRNRISFTNKNFILADSTQAYPYSRSTNTCVKIAKDAAERIIKSN